MKVANLRAVGAAQEQLPVLYGKNRPALARHEFRHDFILSCVVGMERYRCFMGTTHENCCSLNTQNAKEKSQSGVVLSPQGGGFKPRMPTT
jgi:hypothetical protein